MCLQELKSGSQKIQGGLKMANKRLWLVMLAIALVFGMTVVGCDEDSTDELDGTTWEYIGTEDGGNVTITWVLKFNSPNFTLIMSAQGQTETQSGTYSVSGSTVTMTYTEDGETSTGKATLSGNKLTFPSGMEFTKK